MTIVGVAAIEVGGAPPDDARRVLARFVNIANGYRHLQTLRCGFTFAAQLSGKGGAGQLCE